MHAGYLEALLCRLYIVCDTFEGYSAFFSVVYNVTGRRLVIARLAYGTNVNEIF
jgi:hypothetical protein